VLALCSPCPRCPRSGKSCRPHPPPTPVCAMAWHAPPRTLFLTRSTHFVKPHTQSTPPTKAKRAPIPLLQKFIKTFV
jgi:hypothetical protein